MACMHAGRRSRCLSRPVTCVELLHRHRHADKGGVVQTLHLQGRARNQS